MTKSNREWTAQSRGGALGHRIFIKLIQWFGVNTAYVLLAFVAGYFIPFAPKATKSMWYYYREIHHYSKLKTIVSLYKHYFRFGQTLIDKIAVLSGKENNYRFEFSDEYASFISNDADGLVIIGAHMGSWEMGSSFFKEYKKKINIVMYDGEHAAVKNALSVTKQTLNYSIIPINEGGLEAMLKIKIALNNGEGVCFQGDRYLGEEHRLLLPFMGKMAYFPEGPFLLASKLRKPIIFYFAIRQGKTYKFNFTQASSQEKPGSKAYMYDIAKQYTQALEKQVKEHPNQWFNFYPFWEQNT
ncbi:acyltransferase [Gammaproteobacteria bacterium]|nr:acyltransferase [Gammaproteobacteria bacterium]